MADQNQQLNDAKKRIQELDAEIKRLGGEGFKNVNQVVQALGNNLQDATKQIKLMEGEVNDLRNAFGNIASTLKNIVNDINGSVKTSTLLTRNFNKLEDLANKIQRHREEENVLTVKELKELEKKVKKEKEVLETNYKQAQAEAKILETKIKNGKASAKETEEYKKLSSYTDEISQALADKVSYLNQIVPLTEKERKEEERIQKSLGLTGSIMGGITKVFEKIGIQSKYFEDINKDLRSAAKEAGSSKWSVLGAGLGSIGKGLMNSLKDPLVQITLLYKVAKSLFEIGSAYSKTIADTGKNYAIGAQGAKAMVDYTRNVAANAHALAVNNHSALEANNQLNDAFGTSALLSADLIEGQVELTDVLGLQADEAAKISEFSVLQGKTQEEILKDITSQNKGLGNNKKVIQEVAKTSGQLALFYQNSPGLIAKAVVQAQKLGLSLEQTKGISDQLLDIESSLANEYEAEALIGKDLNLNRARQLALEGDVAGAAEEVLKNIKSSAEFSNMNRIQQDALAKSLGMSSDELAKSLLHQEKLSKLGNKEKQILAQMRKDGEGKLADEIEAGIVQGKSFELSKAQVSSQQKLEESVQKMKDGFTSLMEGPLGAMVDGLASALGIVGKIMGFLGSIPGVSSLGSLFGVVIGAGALIGGGMMLVRSLTNMFKGKPSGRPGDAMHVVIDGGGGDDGGGGGGYSGGRGGRRGRRGRGGRRGGRGRTKGRGRGRASSLLGLGASLGLGMMDDDDAAMMETGMDAGDIASDAKGLKSGGAPKAPSAAPSAAPKGGGGGGGGFFSKAWNSIKGVGSKALGGLKSMGSGLMKSGGSLLSKAWGGLKSFGGWAWGGIKKAGAAGLDAAAGPVKSSLKVIGKFLGPIMAGIEGVSNIAGTISDAKSRKAAGEKVDTSKLGKDIVKGAAYPMANLAINLIPGVGTAISLADSVLGAFGLSPIKWLSDNLVDWLPDDTFQGLGNYAIGEQKAMAAGGIVTGPTNALVGEAGAEAVVPLKEFYAKIDELISAVRQGGNVYLDGAMVSTKLQSPMAVSTRRTG